LASNPLTTMLGGDDAVSSLSTEAASAKAELPPGSSRWSVAREKGQTDANVYGPFYYARPEEPRTAYCRLCLGTPKLIALGAGGGIYNFMLHLAREHPEFLTVEDRAKMQHNVRAQVKRPRPSESVFTAKIDDMLAATSGLSLVSELSLLISLTGLPFRFTELPAVHSFIAALCPSKRDEIPGRRAVAARLASLYASAMGSVAARVSRAMAPLSGARRALSGQLRNRCSVTLDEWTSSGVLPYIPTMLHFIDEDWQLQALPIACSPLPHPHTAARLCEALQLNLDAVVAGGYEEDDLHTRNLTGITTDGARNVIAMTNESEHQRMRCAAHGIQLALSCAAGDEYFQDFMKPVS
jgi:hypothetical protein